MCYFYRFARQRHLPPFFPPVTFFKAKCLCLSTRCYCVIGGQASECMLAMVQLIWRKQQCLGDLFGNGGRQTVPMASLTYCAVVSGHSNDTASRLQLHTEEHQCTLRHRLIRRSTEDTMIHFRSLHHYLRHCVCWHCCLHCSFAHFLPPSSPLSNFNWPVIGESAPTATNSA